MALTLMKGSEAIAEAAIRAGARYFFGYPITPQTEIPEYMSARMPEVGGCFLQAESEIAAINMVYGAAGTGARVITSSSSPGISLKQEGISYCAGAMVPAVIVNVMRGGPGLGNIQASQGDYFQGTKGGGNGDYHLLTYAPASIQEFIDIMMFAYDKAEKYRIPVLFLADGIIAQMMEPVELPEMVDYKVDPEKKPWACTGWKPGSASFAVWAWNSPFMAAVTAVWMSASFQVGDFLQIFFPCSSRLMHRQTIRLPSGRLHTTRRYPVLNLRLQNGGTIYACPVILQEEVLSFVISIAENWHISVVDYNTNIAQKPGYRIAKTYYCQCLKVSKKRRYPKYSE